MYECERSEREEERVKSKECVFFVILELQIQGTGRRRSEYE